MPKQNRPLVRDGRIQARKKRTERSYLQGTTAAPETEEAEADADLIEDAAELAEAEAEAATEPETALLADGLVAMPPPEPIPAAPARSTTGKLPTQVRAIQQQGVRKRRDVDLTALARRDTQYAIHELRRIAILAGMVIITLIVLGIVLH